MNNLTIFEGNQMETAVKAANMLAKSNLIPFQLRGKVEDIFSILVMGHELNVSPMQALCSINVIQGKPTIPPQLMIALVRSKIPNSFISIKVDAEKRQATCEAARDKDRREEGYTAVWDMEKAELMGLSGKDNYKKQPLTMLRWRAVGEAIRAVFPDVLMGLYFPQELQDFDGKEIQIAPDASDVDIDFPVPEEELQGGPEYRIQNGKYRGKQFKELTLEQLEERADYIEREMKAGRVKDWHNDLYTKIVNYINEIEEENGPS